MQGSIARRLTGALFLAAMLAAASARATSYSNDYSDLWWNPTESGWGIQFVQQANTIFATLFVYDSGMNPAWLTATLTPAGANTFRGDLYLTRGPWFGGAFNPGAVSYRVVGTMTASFPVLERGTLSYTVDGVGVTKAIERQTFKTEDFNGGFVLTVAGKATGCTGIPAGETVALVIGAVIAQGPSTLAADALVVYENDITTCTFDGNYSQSGHYGRSEGGYRCSGGVGAVGASGSYVLSGMQVQIGTLTGSYLQRGSDGCTVSGPIGGVRVE
jgi:hypothetical protein